MTSEEYGQYIDDFELGADVMPGESLTEYIERRRREFESKADGGSIGIEVLFRDKKADGGRVPMVSGGALKGLMSLFKRGGDDAVDLVKQEEIFREGPITTKFLEDVDDKLIKKFVRTRDTKGPGSYGMYDSFDDMPAGLKAAEIIKRFVDRKTGKINYEDAEFFIGRKLKGDETIDELIDIAISKPIGMGKGPFKDFEEYVLGSQKKADGGRVGLFMGGDPLTGQALSIYNSMSAFGFNDQQIANALQEQGLYGGDNNTNNQVTTVQDVINQNANQSGSKLERELIGPGKLKEQYKAQLNNPINNVIYDFKENMKTKLSDPNTKIGKLGINASNVLGSAIGALAGIPGLGFILDKLNAGSTFDRGAIRELNAPMQLGIYNPDKTGTGYFTQGPIQPGISSLSDTYKSGLTDGKFAGVTVDDLGRIQQTGDYNTAENVMAGYNAGFDLGATAFDRYDKIDETIEKEKKKTNVNYAKIKSLQKRQKALTDFALANAAAQRAAKQAAIDRAIARGNKAAEDRARTKSITAGYGGYDYSPGATGPTAAGAGMGVGGGYASDYGFKKGGLATMFTRRR